jgi:hypothetical protein
MTTHIPNLVVHVVNSSNQILEANGVASTFTREPTATVQFVAGNGKIIETDFAAGSADGDLPSGAAVVVDSTNRIIESDGSQGPFRQASIAVRQVGSGSLASMVLRVVDSSNVVLDRLFGNDPLAPGTVLTVEADTPVTNPPALILGLRQGYGAPLDHAVGDIIQIGWNAASVDTETDPLDAAAIISGTVSYTNGAVTAGSTIAYARTKRPGTPDRYSAWTASASFTVPSASSSAGSPVGLLLLLTKAA